MAATRARRPGLGLRVPPRSCKSCRRWTTAFWPPRGRGVRVGPRVPPCAPCRRAPDHRPGGPPTRRRRPRARQPVPPCASAKPAGAGSPPMAGHEGASRARPAGSHHALPQSRRGRWTTAGGPPRRRALVPRRGPRPAAARARAAARAPARRGAGRGVGAGRGRGGGARRGAVRGGAVRGVGGARRGAVAALGRCAASGPAPPGRGPGARGAVLYGESLRARLGYPVAAAAAAGARGRSVRAGPRSGPRSGRGRGRGCGSSCWVAPPDLASTCASGVDLSSHLCGGPVRGGAQFDFHTASNTPGIPNRLWARDP